MTDLLEIINQRLDDNEYVDKKIWRWVNGGYTAANSDTFIMKPYEGYWVKAKKKNMYLVFLPSAQVDITDMDQVVAGVMNRLKTWVTDKLLGPDTAFADGDSPPMPMCGLNDGAAGGDTGCFISTSTDKVDN